MLKKYRSKNYLNQIVISMFILFIVISIPFSFATYRLAEKSKLESINETNRKVLQQIRFNYDYNLQTIGSVMQSIFHRSDVIPLLYNESSEEYQVFTVLNELEKNILEANPSLHSVYLYNQKNGRTITTGKEGNFRDDELINFVETNKPIKGLQPYLRKIPRTPENPEAYMYVFTYFVYDFEGNDNKVGSLLAVNQRTNWILDNLATMNKNSTTSSEFLLIDEKGNICNNNVKIEDNDEYRKIIQKFLLKENAAELENEEGLGFYTESSTDLKYLVSYLKIGEYNNHILVIQQYDQVFSDLIQLRKNFILCSVLLFVFSIGVILILAKRIYKPINNLVKDISSLMKSNEVEIASGNEFDYLKNAYKRINDQYITIESKKMENQDIAVQYYLENLLLSSQEQHINNLQKKFSNHWIFEEDMKFCVTVIRLDDEKQIEEKNSEKEIQLLLFGIQNILIELLLKKFHCEAVKIGMNSFVVLLGRKEKLEEYQEDLREGIVGCQKYVSEYFQILFSASFSEIHSDKFKLSLLHNQAEEIMEYRFALGRGHVISWDSGNHNRMNEKIFNPRGLADMMVEQINDAKTRKHITEQLCQEIKKLNYNNMMIVLFDFVTYLKIKMDQRRAENKDVIIFDIVPLLKSITNTDYLDDIMNLINQRFEDVLEPEKEEDDPKEVTLIKTVTEYINKNYADSSFCLNMIADEIGVSSKYLSSVFKRHTNMSFNEYILSARMVKAGELIAETNQTIIQIMGKIGMENESYFYRMFKKYYGFTPKEYSMHYKLKKMAND